QVEKIFPKKPRRLADDDRPGVEAGLLRDEKGALLVREVDAQLLEQFLRRRDMPRIWVSVEDRGHGQAPGWQVGRSGSDREDQTIARPHPGLSILRRRMKCESLHSSSPGASPQPAAGARQRDAAR